MVKVVVGHTAKIDLMKIAAYTNRKWGRAASIRYKQLIALARQRISENPYLPISRIIINSSPPIRALDLSGLSQPDSAMRVKNPAHIIYYRLIDTETVEILRILHKKMDRNAALDKSFISLKTP